MKNTPCLALTGEPWGVFYEVFRENVPRVIKALGMKTMNQFCVWHGFVYPIYRHGRVCQQPVSERSNMQRLCQPVQLHLRSWLGKHSLWNKYVLPNYVTDIRSKIYQFSYKKIG